MSSVSSRSTRSSRAARDLPSTDLLDTDENTERTTGNANSGLSTSRRRGRARVDVNEPTSNAVCFIV